MKECLVLNTYLHKVYKHRKRQDLVRTPVPGVPYLPHLCQCVSASDLYLPSSPLCTQDFSICPRFSRKSESKSKDDHCHDRTSRSRRCILQYIVLWHPIFHEKLWHCPTPGNVHVRSFPKIRLNYPKQPPRQTSTPPPNPTPHQCRKELQRLHCSASPPHPPTTLSPRSRPWVSMPP